MIPFLGLWGCADPHFEAGERAERAGRWDSAVEAYTKAIRDYPNHYDAARRIARIECYGRKRARACREWATRLESLEPDRAGARRLLVEADYLDARDRLRAGDASSARRELAKVVAREPGHARALYLDGVAAERLGDREGALRAYGRALRARPRWKDPLEARRRLSGR